MGQLLRIILILVALWLVLRFIRRLWSGTPGTGPGTTAKTGDAMVRCAHCGVFLPQSQAVHKGAVYFCSREHAGAAKDD